MKFRCIEEENISARSIYHVEEESLMTYGGKLGASLCIENTHLTIDLDIDTGLFVGISGFLGDLKNYPTTKISDIVFKKGMLIYRNSKHLEKGIGYNVGYKGKILFDKTKGILVISMENQPQCGKWFRVTDNIYVLVSSEKLCEIRIEI